MYIGITTTVKGSNIINIEYECGCSYNHYYIEKKCIFTTLCKKHNTAMEALVSIFGSGKPEE